MSKSEEAPIKIKQSLRTCSPELLTHSSERCVKLVRFSWNFTVFRRNIYPFHGIMDSNSPSLRDMRVNSFPSQFQLWTHVTMKSDLKCPSSSSLSLGQNGKYVVVKVEWRYLPLWLEKAKRRRGLIQLKPTHIMILETQILHDARRAISEGNTKFRFRWRSGYTHPWN